MEKNPLKMACSFPCGRAMRNGHTRNPLTLRNAFVNAQLHTPCNLQSVQLRCCNISQHSFLLTLSAAAVFTTSMAFPRMLECCNNISQHSCLLTPLAAAVFVASMAFLRMLEGCNNISERSFDSFGCCSIYCKDWLSHGCWSTATSSVSTLFF